MSTRFSTLFPARAEVGHDVLPEVGQLARRLATREPYAKADIASALQQTLSRLERPEELLYHEPTLSHVLHEFGVRRLRVEGLPAIVRPSIITMTHFYAILDVFLVLHALRGAVDPKKIFICGRGNTLRGVMWHGKPLSEAFGSQFVEIQQRVPGGPIENLSELRRTIDAKLADGGVMLISCVTSTEPIEVGKPVKLRQVGSGFALFAQRAKVPVYSVSILLRASAEALLSFCGPFAPPSSSHKDLKFFASNVLMNTEARLRALLAEEEDSWPPSSF